MRRLFTLAIVALALAAPTAAEAGKLVGKKAPKFSASYVINDPKALNLEQCLGDVVLIKAWGIQ
ncbi:MAG: hypothetical protein AAF581_20595 [Planctomycetota bacterium]